MTTLTIRQNHNNPLPLLLVALLLIGILIGAAIAALQATAPALEDDTMLVVMDGVEVDVSRSHGPIKHPGEAEAVRRCIQDRGVISRWINPVTGHNIDVCQLPDGRFGLHIYRWMGEYKEEITSFIKQKMTRWEQVANYLHNSGAIPK